MANTLVLGIGNTLLGDEGIGIHAIAYLRAHFPACNNCTYLDGGTLSFPLAADISDHDNLIVIDAAQLKQSPGSVHCLEGSEMDTFLGSTRRSVHEVSLLDLMDMARLTDTLPENRALIGIQPKDIGWSEQPSTEAGKSIPEAAAHVIRLIGKWQSATTKAPS